MRTEIIHFTDNEYDNNMIMINENVLWNVWMYSWKYRTSYMLNSYKYEKHKKGHITQHYHLHLTRHLSMSVWITVEKKRWAKTII
jgi:hypothetical protein